MRWLPSAPPSLLVLWLPPSVIANVTTELIAFFTIQSAVIIAGYDFYRWPSSWRRALTVAERLIVINLRFAARWQFWTTLLFL